MARIELEQVSKLYGRVSAVDNVSLDIADGEFMVLVGPSGCGKTTLLRMIAGLADTSAGRILFDGADITGLPPGRRNVAMVFQNYALFPHMTVERNLSFGLRLRHAKADARREQVAEVARLLRIEPLLARFPRELSGGQKQRVALGRALIRRPVAFLFDEPLSNLDPALRVEMRAEIKRLHERFPVTTVYVTHDQVEALTMGRRIAVMDSGRIRQVGAPLEVYRDPADMFTAGFIGSPAMNFAAVALEPRGERLLCHGEHGLIWELGAAALGWRADWPRRLVLGVRPEHLALCDPAAANATGAQVALVEKLGRECIVHMRRAGLELRCVSTAPSPPEQGETVHCAPDALQILAFDADSGERLR
jgi:multiple sugar transport system ATP-binding protein